ncbi:prolipoprotein diacylglyceryl transferase [Dysgonomonas macrotermitis]|uniref:Phosphatidylglycerol--prolipoprotein diacylglyceryl transferase n=1 Tax=Dysgonomonas macrotermitis TaxID=1346286 RepID=A0A1M5G796_9BACT|nr:prolipoprotein diacylglyceryl transferase [Dysgonomonas macrotermitis]SHF99589.1 prolipoprotein diacylglyceryl transferase [Dysgonomonas macrotermitis]
MLTFVTWDINPELFNLFGREVRWYGLCWAVGILCTSYFVQKMYKYEKEPDKLFDRLFLYVVVGLIVGARLGHCLFYDPVHYLSNPLELFKIWEGGLASHGGAIGMTLAVCFYSQTIDKKKINWKQFSIFGLIGLILGLRLGYCFFDAPEVYLQSPFKMLMFWDGGLSTIGAFLGLLLGLCVYMVYLTREMTIRVLDRLVIGVAIGAAFIRLGNLMNSEIYGGPTTMPWGFNFVLDRNWHLPLEMGGAGELPCHPTQIYEALIYLIIFGAGMYMFYKTKAKEKRGLILGISLIGIFFSRFLIEYIKYVQEPFEIQMRETIGMNMGQLLSLPFVIWGICLIYNSLKEKK